MAGGFLVASEAAPASTEAFAYRRRAGHGGPGANRLADRIASRGSPTNRMPYGGRSEGTSPFTITPVTGTIIMVVITVVLAAVLYIMVASIGGP